MHIGGGHEGCGDVQFLRANGHLIDTDVRIVEIVREVAKRPGADILFI